MTGIDLHDLAVAAIGNATDYADELWQDENAPMLQIIAAELRALRVIHEQRLLAEDSMFYRLQAVTE